MTIFTISGCGQVVVASGSEFFSREVGCFAFLAYGGILGCCPPGFYLFSPLLSHLRLKFFITVDRDYRVEPK